MRNLRNSRLIQANKKKTLARKRKAANQYTNKEIKNIDLVASLLYKNNSNPTFTSRTERLNYLGISKVLKRTLFLSKTPDEKVKAVTSPSHVNHLLEPTAAMKAIVDLETLRRFLNNEIGDAKLHPAEKKLIEEFKSLKSDVLRSDRLRDLEAIAYGCEIN